MSTEIRDEGEFRERVERTLENLDLNSQPKILYPTANVSTEGNAGAPGGFSSILFPIREPIKDHGPTGLVTEEFDANYHIHLIEVTGDITFAISNPPPSTLSQFMVLEITMDATGGYTLTWPGSVQPTPVVDTSPNAVTRIRIRTTDGGTTWWTNQVLGDNLGDHIATMDLDMQNWNIISSVAPTGGDQFRIVFDAHDDSDTYVSNLTVVDTIQVVTANTIIAEFRPTEMYFDKQLNMNLNNINFGSSSATTGLIRMPNNTDLRWSASPSNVDREAIFSYDVDENFLYTVSGEHQFYIGDALKSNILNITTTGIDMLGNTIDNIHEDTIINCTTAASVDGANDWILIADVDGAGTQLFKAHPASLPGDNLGNHIATMDLDMQNSNIQSTTAPTAMDQFRIIFDADDDSDTYISNLTTTDTIQIVTNNTILAEFRPTELYVDDPLNMNLNNINFGTSSATTGLIRMVNNTDLRWGASPSNVDREGILSYDVDENFLYTASGEHQFYIGDAVKSNILNITTTGIDMLGNTIDNIHEDTIINCTTAASVDTANDWILIADVDGAGTQVFKAHPSSFADNLGNHTATTTLNMDGNPISFGATSAGSGLIRLPNSSEIRWESSPASTNEAAISFTADEMLFTVAALDTFGWWAGDAVKTKLMELNSTGLDMQTNSISFGADPADTGYIRLPNAGEIAWEASPAGADIRLTVNSSEELSLLASSGFNMNGVNLKNATIDSTNDLSGTIVIIGLSYSDGVKQTFNPNGTNAGINVGSQAGDPSTLSNGDIWYNSTSNKFRGRENGSSVDLIGGGSSLPHSDGNGSTNIIQNTSDTSKTLRYSLVGQGTGLFTTLSTSTTSTSKTITFPNITGELMSLAGTQTVSGNKTFSSTIVSTAAATALDCTDADINNINILDFADTHTIQGVTSGIEYDVGDSNDWHEFKVNSVDVYRIDTDGPIMIDGTFSRAISSGVCGYFVTPAGSGLGSFGSVQIPYDSGSVGNAAGANTDFGSQDGCIGIYGNSGGNPTLCVRVASNKWIAITVTSTAISGGHLT